MPCPTTQEEGLEQTHDINESHICEESVFECISAGSWGSSPTSSSGPLPPSFDWIRRADSFTLVSEGTMESSMCSNQNACHNQTYIELGHWAGRVKVGPHLAEV